jgi:hypothetical protein
VTARSFILNTSGVEKPRSEKITRHNKDTTNKNAKGQARVWPALCGEEEVEDDGGGKREEDGMRGEEGHI